MMIVIVHDKMVDLVYVQEILDVVNVVDLMARVHLDLGVMMILITIGTVMNMIEEVDLMTEISIDHRIVHVIRDDQLL